MEKVFDAHIHHTFDIPMEKAVEIFKKEFAETGVEGGIFLSVPHHEKGGVIDYECLQNVKMLYLKREFSPNFYAYAALVHPMEYLDKKSIKKEFLRQVKEYFSVGYDGIKMLEGYPSLLKVRGIPLDDEIYDDFYAFMQENGYPITIHIANPAVSWDITKASKELIQAGRVYDSSYPSKEEITAQIFRVMKKYPKLRLTLAHFGFLIGEKENAERFLGDYENTCLDITPGGEQYFRMLQDWDIWLAFIEKYQDKLLYGTDFYAFPNDDEAVWRTCFTRRPNFVRQFIETDDQHLYIDKPFQGVKLEEKLRSKIYRDNAKHIFSAPKKIDEAYLYKETEKFLSFPNKIKKYADEDIRFMLNDLQ